MIKLSPKRDLCVREKLLEYGVQHLSDAELLAIFISSGSGKKSCVQLAHDLINHLGDLRNILNTDINTFQQVRGLGLVRFVQLQAMREICRRSDYIGLKQSKQLLSTKQAYTYIKRQLRDKRNETFVALFLDSQHRVLSYEELFSGTINSASIHTRPIVERVLKLNAAALILAHNHPSGISDASNSDIVVTTRIQEALALVDAILIDHLIVGDNEVYSILHQMKTICY